MWLFLYLFLFLCVYFGCRFVLSIAFACLLVAVIVICPIPVLLSIFVVFFIYRNQCLLKYNGIEQSSIVYEHFHRIIATEKAVSNGTVPNDPFSWFAPWIDFDFCLPCVPLSVLDPGITTLTLNRLINQWRLFFVEGIFLYHFGTLLSVWTDLDCVGRSLGQEQSKKERIVQLMQNKLIKSQKMQHWQTTKMSSGIRSRHKENLQDFLLI